MLKKTTLAKLAAIYSIIAVLSLNFDSSVAYASAENITTFSDVNKKEVEEDVLDDSDGEDVTENAQAGADSDTNPTVDTNTSPLPHYTGYKEPGISTMRDKPKEVTTKTAPGAMNDRPLTKKDYIETEIKRIKALLNATKIIKDILKSQNSNQDKELEQIKMEIGEVSYNNLLNYLKDYDKEDRTKVEKALEKELVTLSYEKSLVQAAGASSSVGNSVSETTGNSGSSYVLDPKTDSYVMVEEDGFTQYKPTASELLADGASRAGKQALEAFKSVKIWATGASKSKESSPDSEEVNRHKAIPQDQKLEYIYVDPIHPDLKADGYTATAIENTAEGMSPYNPTASELASDMISRRSKEALEAAKSVKKVINRAVGNKKSSTDSEEVNRHQAIPQNQKLEYIYVDPMHPDMKGDGYTATAIENTAEGMTPYNPTTSELLSNGASRAGKQALDAANSVKDKAINWAVGNNPAAVSKEGPDNSKAVTNYVPPYSSETPRVVLADDNTYRITKNDRLPIVENDIPPIDFNDQKMKSETANSTAMVPYVYPASSPEASAKNKVPTNAPSSSPTGSTKGAGNEDPKSTPPSASPTPSNTTGVPNNRTKEMNVPHGRLVGSWEMLPPIDFSNSALGGEDIE